MQMNSQKKDFAEFNAALDRLMRGGSFTEAAHSAASISEGADFAGETNRHENTADGTLILQVSTANGSLPIQGAKVTIMQNDNTVIDTLTTNNSGKTVPIRLSAPALEYSQTPGNIVPYSTYNIRVEKPGYYTQEFFNIPIFAGIKSIQGVSLEPLGENAMPGDRLAVNETQPNVLITNEGVMQ